jgi:thiol-disulfide isomerase/thioredoxin
MRRLNRVLRLLAVLGMFLPLAAAASDAPKTDPASGGRNSLRGLNQDFNLPGQAPPPRAKSTAFLDITGVKQFPLDTKDAKAVVLIFMTHDCPVANYYTSEITAIVKEFSTKPVRFYLVHVDPELSTEAARKHAALYGLTCPIVIDAKHQLVKATGVTVTPEAAVLSADGKIAYRGRIDDIYVELGKRRVAPNQRDLREALAALLAGKPIREPRTKAIGCFIPDLPKDGR